MPRLTFTATEARGYLKLLEETAKRLRRCSAAYDDDQLSIPPLEGEWSPAQVLGHLRACAEVWSSSIYAMLAQEHPSLPDIHPRRWAQERGYPQAGFHASFEAFFAQRQELLGVLHVLPDDRWSRSAEIGRRTHNVFSQVRRMAKHEGEHCKQVEMLLACRGEV